MHLLNYGINETGKKITRARIITKTALIKAETCRRYCRMEYYQYFEYHLPFLYSIRANADTSDSGSVPGMSALTQLIDNAAKGDGAKRKFYECADGAGWSLLSPYYNDISPCMVQGLFLGGLALFAILAGSHQLWGLYHKKVSVSNRISPFFYLKLLLVIVQIGFHLVMILHSTSTALIHTVKILNFVGLFVISALHYLENFKATVANGVLLFYWLFSVLVNGLKAVNYGVRDDIGSVSGTVSVLSVVNAAIILTIEGLVPIKSVIPSIPTASYASASPYANANIFSRLTFTWMTGLMRTGYFKYLEESDLPRLPQELRADDTTAKFQTHWNNQNVSKPSIVVALVKAFGGPFLLGGFFKASQDALSFVQPYLLKLLIQFVNDFSESKKQGDPLPLTRGFMIAGAMFLVSVCQTTFLHQYFEAAFNLGMKIKSSLTSVVYNKAIIMSNEAKLQSNTGDIVNLMSVDILTLLELVQYVQLMWSGPFQIVLCLLLLYNLVGHAMWAGVAIMVIMIPVNSVIAKAQKRLQKTQMKTKDERSRLMSEILNNIKSLKFYAWEVPYLDKLRHIRNDKELANLKVMAIFHALMTMLWNFAPVLVSCSTFALFIIIEKRPLSVDIVFPALTLFNLLSFPLAVIPQVVSSLVEAQVSLERMHKFLHGDDLQADAVIKLPATSKVGDLAVEIDNASFLYGKPKSDTTKPALSSINLTARKGHLDCIVGKVGSGKSSVIQAILGDLYKVQGTVKIYGNVAYVAQVPWIMNGSVKDNILFGHKYDPEFYQHVIKACALTVDLKILPKGDQTQVGEKGISLSGGQKARLSLARAVYARADVYLIDDALSAVDEHVGRHLIDHVLGPKGLLNTRCRILATNNIRVLSIADNLHMVSEGEIIEQGTYSEIMTQSESKLFSLIKEFGRKEETSETTETSPDVPETTVKSTDPVPEVELDSEDEVDTKSLRRASVVTLDERLEDALDKNNDDEDEEIKKRKEHAEQGKVKWDVYIAYAKACNPRNIAIWLVSLVLGQLTLIGSGLWLKYWSEVNTDVGYNPDVVYYLGIYLLLGLLTAILLLVQFIICLIYCSVHASKILHNNMAVNVLRAPMSFFETTPIGRILNRFSNDMFKVDLNLIRVFGMFFTNSIKVSFSIAVICFSTWQVILLIIPLLVLYLYYQQYYMRTSRELRRLDSVSRSPIYADFQETLNGVTTIRAYNHSQMFKFMNSLKVDKNMRAYHPAINANRWLAVRLEFLSAVIILGAAGFSILSLNSGTLSAGLVGLSVSYSLQITQSLNWIVRMTVEVETNIVSVERILEYSRLTSEAPEIIDEKRPSESWPVSGTIKFNNYSTRYRPELDLVLKNINLSINAKEKIGIVGRTGAGKSSLTLALFRIIEAAEGNIDIDNVVTSEIGLRDLRQRLSIIPQDSQVFEGTIKSNLDPFDRFSNAEIWKALELSHLKDHVLKMFNEAKKEYDSAEDKSTLTEIFDGLDVKLQEGGSNLSVGQRQLMCLARALLIPSHILVLDEATAAVDVETDKILQTTIRHEFKDRTILTIAHRINTILDSDKIIVLEKGEVAEFDTPENLLKNEDSLFYALCKQGGFVQ